MIEKFDNINFFGKYTIGTFYKEDFYRFIESLYDLIIKHVSSNFK